MPVVIVLPNPTTFPPKQKILDKTLHDAHGAAVMPLQSRAQPPLKQKAKRVNSGQMCIGAVSPVHCTVHANQIQERSHMTVKEFN